MHLAATVIGLLCIAVYSGVTLTDVPVSCEGLDNIAKSESLDCVRTDDCLSETCNVSNDAFPGYGAILYLIPCHDPPSLEILLISPRDIDSLGKFDSTQATRTTAVLLENSPVTSHFRITVAWSSAHTASIMGDIDVGGTTTVVLLEETNVTLPACEEDNTTCSALQKIAANANSNLHCITNGVKDCDTISCNYQPPQLPQVSIEMRVLPCHNQSKVTAIHLLVRSGTLVILNRTLTESTEIQETFFTVNVTLIQLDEAVGLMVDVYQGDGTKLELLKYSIIPIDTEKCIKVNAIKDQQATCDALQSIADETQTDNCTINKEKYCDAILCTTLFEIFGGLTPVQYSITILPCNKPPGVKLELETSIIKFSETFTTNSTANIFMGVIGEITVVQWPDAIGLEVVILAPAFGVNDTAVEFTRIPIFCEDNTTCSALQKIAANANSNLHCITNGVKDCDTITCNYQPPQLPQVSIEMRVLPCHNQSKVTAIHLLVRSGTLVNLNRTLTESTEIQETFFTVNVTLIQLDEAVGLMVDVYQGDGTKLELLKYSIIPIDTEKCIKDEGGTEMKTPDETTPGDSSATLLLGLSPWCLLLISSLLTSLY